MFNISFDVRLRVRAHLVELQLFKNSFSSGSYDGVDSLMELKLFLRTVWQNSFVGYAKE
jgi:hypothetical protein